MSGEAAAIVQPLDLAIARACEAVSHNLNGQKLGRKGRETRERIVRAAIEELESGSAEVFTLSAVARRALLGMSSLYNYFTDLSELMLAVLVPVMDSARVSYMSLLDEYWPDSELEERSRRFWACYAEFWNNHAAILHQRNRMSDCGDERMLRCRIEATLPLMEGIALQLGQVDGLPVLPAEQAMASVLTTMLERTVTVQSQPSYRQFTGIGTSGMSTSLGNAGAQLLALAAQDCRRRRRIGAEHSSDWL